MDRAAIEEHGIPGYTLMQRAAAEALATLRLRWPDARSLRIYCGLGNNAGDGYVVARLAQSYDMQVTVVACAAPDQLGGDAATAAHDCAAAGISPVAFTSAGAPQRDEVIVDALFGTGLSRPLENEFADAVRQINASACPVLALDIPSGLAADTGLVQGPAVRADCTIGFVGLKSGYFLGAGPEHCGAIDFADLDIPATVRDQQEPVLQRIGLEEIRFCLPPRSRNVHKGDNGRLLIIGGGPGMPGAVRMAGAAALRAGAGLVYVATHPQHAAFVTAETPELIVHATESPADIAALAETVQAIAIGPGLGRSRWATALCEWAFALEKPLIADADALNWLAETSISAQQRPLLLTPHPGEAGRLLGRSGGAIQSDRLGAVRSIAERFAATTALKGAATLVADPGSGVAGVCAAGNPGMATAGTGDVLTGICGGVLVQCGDTAAAARAAVLIHALAGDAAASAGGERGLIATDLLEHIRLWANPP